MSRLKNAELAERAIQHAASIAGCPCDFILGTAEKPYCGGQCAIFVFETTSNREKIAIRLEHTPSTNTNYQVMEEVKHLEAIKKARIAHVPELLGYSISNNPSPFIALRWAEGESLQWTDQSPEISHRDEILRVVAQVTVDLLDVQVQGCSAFDWMEGKIQRSRLARAGTGRLLDISVKECQALLDSLQDFHIPKLDHAPHVQVHGDLQASNIIIGTAMQVESVIDWGFSTMVPLQYAVMYPRFLTSEPQLIGGVSIWNDRTPMMNRDRRVYLQFIRNIASSRGGIAQDYYDILARQDEDSRYWWMSAVGRLDIMRAMRYKNN